MKRWNTWLAMAGSLVLGLAMSGCEGLEDAAGGDGGIDLGRVVWLHENVSNWPVTTSLEVSIGGGAINLNYGAARSWPSRSINGVQVNANPWIFVNMGGTWYAGTWEWFRPGQTSKPMGVVEGGHIGVAPLNRFRPVSGETYGFMVSTPARGGTRSINERSNVVMARWP